MQATLSAALGSPPTGYLLEYHVYDNTSTIELPALNTSYTLDSVPSGAVYTITVSALNDVGPSENNPSVQFGELSILHKDVCFSFFGREFFTRNVKHPSNFFHIHTSCQSILALHNV